jgi:hypothetical protein
VDFELALLPEADTSERCAAHSARIGLDVAGTALALDRVIGVDVPLPWPKPVWAAEGFDTVRPLMDAAEASDTRLRVLATAALEGSPTLVAYDQLSSGVPRRQVVEAADVATHAELIAAMDRIGVEGTGGTVTDPIREIWVCGQGSHDVCCGSKGTSLMGEICVDRPDLEVRKVSHTGGHKMAPTSITFPDARMWGLTTAEEMMAIVDHSVEPREVLHRCRGWLGAPTGPGQVAEIALAREVNDWAYDQQPRTVTVTDRDERSARVVIDALEQQFEFDLRVRRVVPTIACGEPGGLPAKPAVEWMVVD